MRNRGFAALILLLVLSVTSTAVTPQFWENFTQADLLEGSLDRISLTSDGKLFLSQAYDMVFDTEQSYIFSMVRDTLGNIYIGTGDDGKVFRIDPQGKGALYFQAEELNVFAMAIDNSDCLYVGSSPDGKVYKVTGPNQSTEYFNSGGKYIWSMIFDVEDNLYIGTGGGGVIYKVDSSGDKTVFYQCGDIHIMCLAWDGNGNLLSGTSPSGLVIEINPEGKGFTLFDSPMEEVHSLTFDTVNGIYAIASSSSGMSANPASGSDIATGKADPVSSVKLNIESIVGSQKPKTSNSIISTPGGDKTTSGARSVVYAISRDRSTETVYSSGVQMVFDSAVRGDGTLLLATGPKGRLLSIDAAKQVSVISDSSEEHLTRILAEGDAVYAGSSNQGKVFKLQPERTGTGEFESKILDAKTVSSLGKIFWHVTKPQEARFEFSTRTGNTGKIDNSWSAWSPAYTSSGQQIVSPAARYLQWRVSIHQDSSSDQGTLSDLLERIQISYLQQNLRPQVVTIEALPFGVAFQRQASLISSASLAVSATMPDGRSLNAPRERGKSTPNPSPRQVLQPGAQSFKWKARDENQDSLEYSLYFKGESGSGWKLLEEKYRDTFYTLYASSLPDGIYRLKVIASDAPSNPYDGFLISELVSQPFMIANALPWIEITGSEVDEKKVEVVFDSRVQTGNVATSEFAIDGGEWRLVFPIDGIADSVHEEYRITTPDLSVGEHLIMIRASDRDGNTGISKVIVRIP